MLAAINWGILNMIDKTRKWHDDCLKGVVGPRYAMEPAEGEYRCRREDKSVYAVYFWYDRTAEGAPLRCHIDGKNVSEERALRTWEYCGAKNCITPENYWNYIDHGQWLDNDVFAAAAANGPEIDPAADPAGSLKAEIDAARAGVAAYATIDSDEAAARAQTLRSALTGLSGKATKAYEALNRPLLDEQTRIRKVWFPLRDDAAEGADTIRKELGKWEDQKREASKKAQAEADQKASEHEEAVRKAQETNQPPPPPPPAPVAPNMPPPSIKIKGASGRAASVQLKKVVVAIDLDKAFAQFRNEPELYAFLLDLSQRTVTAGYVAIGATVEEKSDIR